jgi:hypothetical protein
MAETRISSDEYRIRRRLELVHAATRYKLDEPGQGTARFFQEDVFWLQAMAPTLHLLKLDLETQLREEEVIVTKSYQDAPKKGRKRST